MLFAIVWLFYRLNYLTLLCILSGWTFYASLIFCTTTTNEDRIVKYVYLVIFAVLTISSESKTVKNN